MEITFRSYQEEDIARMTAIWNDIVEDGIAFPGEERYTESAFGQLLTEQSASTCLLLNGQIAGFFIVHPNHIGRCSHIANASYAIAKEFRGQRLGRPLVKESLEVTKKLGFKAMQYNAVVASNTSAIRIYLELGFRIIGTIPDGYRLKNEELTDMHIMHLGF